MNKFNIGDIVSHKTGKQKMIIVKIDGIMITCRWEKDSQFFCDTFEEYELELDKDDDTNKKEKGTEIENKDGDKTTINNTRKYRFPNIANSMWHFPNMNIPRIQLDEYDKLLDEHNKKIDEYNKKYKL